MSAKFVGEVILPADSPATYYQMVEAALDLRYSYGEFTAAQLADEKSRWRSAVIREGFMIPQSNFYERNTGPGVRNGIVDPAVMTTVIVMRDGVLRATNETVHFRPGQVLIDRVCAQSNGVAATGTIEATDGGTNAATLSVGGKVYTIKTDGTADPALAQINAGADEEEYAANIAAKINADRAVTLCTAAVDGAVVTLTANAIGTAGNAITLSTTDANLTITAFADGAADGGVGISIYLDLAST